MNRLPLVAAQPGIWMAEQLSSQMAEIFEKAINPTFQKMT